MSAELVPVPHHCHKCGNRIAHIAELSGQLRHLVRVIEKHPGTVMAKGSRTQIVAAKELLATERRLLAEHIESVRDEPVRLRAIRDVQRKAEPKPTREKTVLVDATALADAEARLNELAELGDVPRDFGAGTNTRPATGRCHECDRVVSGERRFCGRCMAHRI